MGGETKTKTKKNTVKPKKTKPFFGPKKKLDVKLNKTAKKGKAMAIPLKKVLKKEKTEAQKLQIASLKKPVKEIQGTSKKYQKHKESEKVLKEAQDSAILSSQKANEAVANRSHVEVMDDQTKDTKAFDKDGFKKKLKEQIDDTIKKKSDAEKIKSNGVDENVTKGISKTVGDEKGKAGGKIEASSIEPPAKPEAPKDEATTQEPQKLNVVAPEAKTLTAQKSDLAPVKHTEEETDFTKETQVLDDDYKQNNLSQDKLQNSNEPRFISADNQKQDSETKAQELTDKTRENEKKKINGTRWSNTKSINDGYKAMLDKQSTTNKGRFDQQSQKSIEENKIREDVHKKLTSFFNNANSIVLKCFESIDNYIEKTFGVSITKNLDIFSERVAELLDDNDGIEWVGKKLTGGHVENEVEIFNKAKKEFIEHMQIPLDDLVEHVDTKLTEANNAIKAARKSADTFWKNQSDETKRIAGDIYEETNTKFGELETSVQDKESAVIDTVTEKFSAALEELDERFEKAKIENMSWLDRAIAAVKSVINTIIELKNAIQALAKKAAKYAEAIIDDPITFFGNLADGVGQGFTNFKNNIDKHLIKGVLEWLTGSMAGTDIVLPKELNMEGITSLVLQILGITMKKIKDLVIGVIGKERFEFIEKGVDASVAAGNKILNIFKILNEQGLAGLWEFIKEEFGNLKEMFIENVKTFVVETITMKALEYLLSLLIPGGGFIRAAQLLIKFVVTLFQKAAQIIKIIDGILDTFGDILNKNLGAVVEKVEAVFSGFLSLAISFLAAVLGLDGIVGKVQKFIQQKIRPKIDQILKNIANKIKKVVEKIGLTKLIDKSMKAVEKGKAWVDDKKKKVKDTAKKYGEKILNFLGFKKRFKAVDGKEHTLFFEGSNKKPVFMIASDKMTFELFINKITNESEKKEATAISKKINAILEDDVSVITDVPKREARIKENQNKINSYLERISKIASKYFTFSVMPVSKIQFESASVGGGVMGKKMLAFPLTKNHPEGSESEKDSSNPAYNKVEQRGYQNGSFYVKGHLLNNNLGGPGSWINYTPFPGAIFNTSVHYQKYEKPLKEAIGKDEIFYYKVEALYGRTRPAVATNDSATVAEIKEGEVSVPLSINLEVFKYDFNADTQSLDKSKAQPPFAGKTNEPINIQGDGYYAKGSAVSAVKIYSLKGKTFMQLISAGVDLDVAKKIMERQDRNVSITDYFNQIGTTKEILLNLIKRKDSSYTDISQN
jgi:hypothetical protein